MATTNEVTVAVHWVKTVLDSATNLLKSEDQTVGEGQRCHNSPERPPSPQEPEQGHAQHERITCECERPMFPLVGWSVSPGVPTLVAQVALLRVVAWFSGDLPDQITYTGYVTILVFRYVLF
jgi:hypothetical protein